MIYAINSSTSICRHEEMHVYSSEKLIILVILKLFPVITLPYIVTVGTDGYMCTGEMISRGHLSLLQTIKTVNVP